jgi:predicted  nucleic acid-binding Zn-ribbon protein
VSLAQGTINLSQYQCAQCGRTPTKAQELFHGCTCGHRLFRIIRKQNNLTTNTPHGRRVNQDKKDNKLNFLTVQELEVGRYSINIEKLLSDESDESISSPVIVGNNGIFSIHLKPYKK